MTHPNEEVLTGYLTLDLPESQCAVIDRHVDDCDDCLSAMMTIHRNLARGAEVAVHVPATLLERATPATSPRQWVRPPVLLRYPVLIPTSLAAGLLLAVGIENWQASIPRSETRSVDVRAQTARVVAAEVLVLKRPDERADVVARVMRGATVTVDERQGGWTRIVLADGASGWVANRALE